MRVDAAAYLGPWPFRNIEGTVRGLAATMKELALDHTLVSPMPALFYTDTEPANDELLRRLKGRANLWAVPVVNLRMADAKRYIEQLARHPQVRAVRFAPGFHGYPVSQIKTAFDTLTDHNLAAVIQLRMQDERSHPPTTFVPPVPIEEVISLAESAPAARIAAAAARQGEGRKQLTRGSASGRCPTCGWTFPISTGWDVSGGPVTRSAPGSCCSALCGLSSTPDRRC